MSKKGFGQIFLIATLGGLVAAGISYVLQYRAFHRELEEEFHDFEEQMEPEDNVMPDRNYVALNASKDEFAVTAKGMASAAKDIFDDVESIIKDQASNIKSVAADSSEILKDKVEDHKKKEHRDKRQSEEEEILKDLEALDGISGHDKKKDMKEDFDIASKNTTKIMEQGEEKFVSPLKDENTVTQDVHIKDAKLKSEESTVIDLSSSKDDD